MINAKIYVLVVIVWENENQPKKVGRQCSRVQSASCYTRGKGHV